MKHTKNLSLVVGAALLISVLVLVNMLVFGERDGGDEAPGTVRRLPPSTLQEEVERLPSPITSEQATMLEVLEIVAPGHAPDSVSIAGLVVGEGDHGPISGASVRLTSETMVTTDDLGAFRLEGLEPGRHWLYISASGWAPARVDVGRTVAGQSDQLQITLQRGRNLVIEVHAPSGDALDAPVGDAIIRLYPGGKEVWKHGISITPFTQDSFGIRARTDHDGRALVDEVRSGNHYVLVSAPGHPVWRGDILVQERDEVIRIELSSGGVIEGRVLHSDGRPARGGYAFIGPAVRHFECWRYYAEERARLDERGEFRLTDAPRPSDRSGRSAARGSWCLGRQELRQAPRLPVVPGYLGPPGPGRETEPIHVHGHRRALPAGERAHVRWTAARLGGAGRLRAAH